MYYTLAINSHHIRNFLQLITSFTIIGVLKSCSSCTGVQHNMMYNPSMQSYLLLSIAVCLIIGVTGWNEIICISTHHKNDYKMAHCDFNATNLSKETVQNLTNNTLVLLFDSTIHLQENIIVKNKLGIAFRSNKYETVISCSSFSKGSSSGLTFISVSGLQITDITFANCGVIHNSTSMNESLADPPQLFRSAVYMSNCDNVTVKNSKFFESIGKGLSMFDCFGTNNIVNTSFIGNRVPEREVKEYSGGGGLYIEFTYCSKHWFKPPLVCPTCINNSHYNINNCSFCNNIVTSFPLPNNTKRQQHMRNSFRGIGKGGAALCIFIKGNAFNNTFNIDNIHAMHNSVNEYGYGGAVLVQFQDSPKLNHISFTNSAFSHNNAMNSGGGAFDIGFEFPIQTRDAPKPKNNTIMLMNVFMDHNAAYFGGGVTFFSSSSEDYVNNTIHFINCTWINNNAVFGAAVMIGPQSYGAASSNILPIPEFTYCSFINNTIIEKSYGGTGELKQGIEGAGTLYIKSFTVNFKSSVSFKNNFGSGIYVLDSIIRVTNETTVEFIENEGIFGGAVSLIGASAVQVGNNSILKFTNNSAFSNGGAIYAFSTDKLSSTTFGLCFIQYIDTNPDFGKVTSTFYFEGNKAHERGNSIFVSSLLPCVRNCNMADLSNKYVNESLNCTANFTFANRSLNDSVETEGTVFVPKESHLCLNVIPGKPFKLPVTMKDELGNEQNNPLLRAFVQNNENSSIHLEFAQTADNYLNIFGKPGDTATLKIETVSFHNISLKLNITVSECPPGFLYDKTHKNCTCAASSATSDYNAIFACDNNEFKAWLNVGFWVGYPDKSKYTASHLTTATCPLGFCKEHSDNENLHITLPQDPKQLDKTICFEQNRTGVLCGRCIKGHSVFYHSYRYKCGTNKNCKYGLLFYLISEIIPLTIIFTVIIILHVNFTSGYLNGFVLFAQMIDSLSLSANGGVLIISEIQSYMLDVLHLVYSPFNLDLFHLENLSFCLFQNANFLQIASIKYVTLSYALFLVITLVFIMRCSCCYKLQLICFQTRITRSSSLINGLSAFLVLCYSQCNRACYRILNMAWLHGAGDRYMKTPRVFRMGDLEFMGKEHIGYAFLALFFLTTLIIIPPLFLIIEPISYKLLPENVFDWRKVRYFCSKFNSIRPFLDSLQGCFKDNYRYFAGFYLIYRSIPDFTFAIVNSRLEVFTIVQFLLIFMLALHTWAQPYRNSIHNHIDTVIFTNMLIINTLTYFRYFESQSTPFAYLLSIATYIQLFLAYIPIAILFLVTAICVTHKCWRKKQRSEDELPDLIMSREELTSISSSYHRRSYKSFNT